MARKASFLPAAPGLSFFHGIRRCRSDRSVTVS
ncbi:hypothetical protein JSE7799_01048 [Jannaschia seosinensis]|uniref:Uncharacterized protein n=1 Tax=Jannaschia seosinensis TaxID=313367 RepID=A0A0M7B8S0_9RHOB|nr:hypothetical protein JSE7799_01048 [Jannaschia seosinensis]